VCAARPVGVSLHADADADGTGEVTIELDALSVIADRLLLRPARRGDTSAKVDQVLFGSFDGEGSDHRVLGDS
jgi:hypothetical protein